MDNSTTSIDFLEESIANVDPSILKILLKDKTTRNSILWCTNVFIKNGSNFKETEEIIIEQVTGPFRLIFIGIQNINLDILELQINFFNG